MRLTSTHLILIAATCLSVAHAAPPGKVAVATDASSWPNFRNGHELRGVAAAALPEKLQLLWLIPFSK